MAGTGATLLASALPGCTQLPGSREGATPAAQGSKAGGPVLQLTPIHVSADRITNITVCTRPFRAQGPRIEAEQVGQKSVIHNYGHGGSGWSLSWGSSALATEKAMATGEHDIAVIGCGALGLTSALLLQRAGANVTIYAKDLPPNVRSSNATGVWSPDSRVCLESYATPEFRKMWEGMARQSFRTYQSLLGLQGNPVEFIDSYFATDQPMSARRDAAPARPDRPPFAQLERSLLGDLMTREEEFGPGTHSLRVPYLQRTTTMMFNISSYARMLMSDFFQDGGHIEVTEFHSPADFARLRQKTVVNATGYGARALFGDKSITPVRGQIAHMIPQPELTYSLYYKTVFFVPRRDGLVFQATGEDDYYGFGNDDTTPDRDEAEFAVRTIAELFAPS